MSLAPLHILLVEDDDAYATLVASELSAAGLPASLYRVRTLAQATAAVANQPIDVILLDLALPDSAGMQTVDRMQAASHDTPIVVLTSNDDDVSALQALKRGAQDYLIKDTTDPHLLARSLRYARERAALQGALRERESRFRALVEHSYDVITLVDRQGRIVFDSRAIERISGFSPDERVGLAVMAFVHPDEHAELERHLAECLSRSGHVMRAEYRYRHKDGTWRWGEAACVNRLEDPAVGAIVVNHRDVTERKLAEEALRASEQQLRQAHKMEAVGRLAGGVAHDFNNVLTAIFGYVDLLLDQFDADDPRRSDVTEIRRSAERAAALTRQLLAFSRKQVMQPRVIDLHGVVAGLEGLLARLVTGDIAVEIQAAADLWQVRADPGQLEQVVMNLAANARDAMPEGGRLVLITRNVTADAEHVRQRPGLRPGDYVTLTVSDTGTGIPEDVRRHIFEPFFTTKEQEKGTGLGLAMVYGIIKQMGGAIYVESEAGEGTRFVIYLPRVEESAAATSSP
jgi:hypothetical protein